MKTKKDGAPLVAARRRTRQPRGRQREVGRTTDDHGWYLGRAIYELFGFHEKNRYLRMHVLLYLVVLYLVVLGFCTQNYCAAFFFFLLSSFFSFGLWPQLFLVCFPLLLCCRTNSKKAQECSVDFVVYGVVIDVEVPLYRPRSKTYPYTVYAYLIFVASSAASRKYKRGTSTIILHCSGPMTVQQQSGHLPNNNN